MNRRPQLFGLHPVAKVEKTGQALINKLEDDWYEYRSAVENRYCKDDPAVHADFKAKLAAARAAL